MIFTGKTIGLKCHFFQTGVSSETNLLFLIIQAARVQWLVQ